MKLIIQKTKKVMQIRLLNWLIGVLAFVGILSILILTQANDNAFYLKPIIALLTLAFFLSFIYEYFAANKTSKALADLTKTITSVEQDMAVSLTGQDDSYYIMAISNVLNQSLSNLKEKNLKLESEMERNQRLSENISEFYHQMKMLRETDFKFDFFEYEIKHQVFIFITGLVTFTSNNSDITEITTEDLFKSYNFNIDKEAFLKLVHHCVEEDVPLNFECNVTEGDSQVHYLKFWGRVCEDRTRITGAITEITREVLQRNLEKERAIHDNITGFYNRNALSEIAGKALSECKPGEMVIFIYIGLTGYQDFQERYGMVAGNTYIRACAEMFKKFLNNRLIPFRWWGADFLLLATGIKHIENFKQEALSVIQKVEKFIGEVDGIAVTFPIAMGYSVSGLHGDTPSELLEYAAFAEHEALRGKADNPNGFEREKFEEARRASLRRTFIKDIIDRNQLSVVFQPIISLKSGELYGFEALSRPMNPIYRSIIELLDDAEASGHYTVLEKRMVYNALDAYMLRSEHFKDQYLFINTAPYATLDENDYNDIRDRYFGHMKVVFEVIERNRMDPEEINLRKAIVTKAGAKFALDDFGSGYSNHLALLALEPDIIKLDRELVRGINSDLRKQHMLEDIVSYARYRRTKVLAEGVETRDELETLCRMGIDLAQGYYLGRPVPEIAGADKRAQEVIHTMKKGSEINVRNLLVMFMESLPLIESSLTKKDTLATYLVLKIAERLEYPCGRLTAIVITTIMHDIGYLYPACNQPPASEDELIPNHSLYAYLLMKEYYPYAESAKAVLYHHYTYEDSNKVFNSISIPEEAYLLSLANFVAEQIIGNTEADAEALWNLVNEKKYFSEHVKHLKELLNEELLDKIRSGEYKNELLYSADCLKVGKAEVESVIRTFVYAVMFRTPYTYSHAKIMETSVSIMARLTKQNWKLVEKARLSALLYNLSRLTLKPEDVGTVENAEEENRMVRESVSCIVNIMRETGLMDIMDILNAVNGEECLLSENRVLMGKDIIIGSRMLNISDIFASLLEDRPMRNALTCVEAMEELKKIMESNNSALPMLDIMDEYIEDIEGRILSVKAEINKRYQSVINNYYKLKERISIKDYKDV